MNAREIIELYATLADMKDVDCRNATAVLVLVDLLIEKGVISRQEWTDRLQQLDATGD